MAAEMERGNPSLPTLTSHPWVSGRLWAAWGEAGELLKAHVLRGALDGRLKVGEAWVWGRVAVCIQEHKEWCSLADHSAWLELHRLTEIFTLQCYSSRCPLSQG